MASTATNKQPLLVDRVLHKVYNLDLAITPTLDISGTNTAVMILDATTSDGAIIEYMYSIARSTVAATINLYITSAIDYLRPNEGIFIGQFDSATTVAEVTTWPNMPGVLAPTAHTGNDPQLKALYIPKGVALWAARQSTENLSDGPLIGIQGGWY